MLLLQRFQDEFRDAFPSALGDVVKTKPEFDDVREIAERTGLPVREILKATEEDAC